MNGQTAFEDLLALARNYNGSPRVYDQGDFDYNGMVDFNDLLVLAKSYGAPLSAIQALVDALAPAPTVTRRRTTDGATASVLR